MTDVPHQPAPPATLFVFGAHGDLVQRLLVPSLYRLCRDGLLDADMQVHGIDHNDATDESFRKRLGAFLEDLSQDAGAEGGGEPVEPACWRNLRERLHYLKGDFEDEATYRDIAECIGRQPSRNAVFYLATSPGFFGTIVERLASAGLLDESAGGFRRIAVEKPFGSDLASARALDACIGERLAESQVFRVDHFMAKDAARNIAVHRFANGIVEGFWHAGHIDHVQISALETLDVGTRGRFYDRTGALRDMVPNHLFQLLALVAMEPPAQAGEAGWREARTELIRAIRVPDEAGALRDSVFGQYTGRDGVTGYRDTPNVAPDSRTETFVALRLEIDTPRWRDVPFYLRTGKCLSRRSTEIAVQFRPPAGALASAVPGLARLVFTLDPEENLRLAWTLRPPGPVAELARAALAYRPTDRFPARAGTGYEAVLYHCLCGNRTLFQSAGQVEAAWAVMAPFQQAWAEREPEPYAAGTDGPVSARALLERDGRDWWRPQP